MVSSTYRYNAYSHFQNDLYDLPVSTVCRQTETVEPLYVILTHAIGLTLIISFTVILVCFTVITTEDWKKDTKPQQLNPLGVREIA